MDVGQSSQSNSQRTEFQTSPFKETQTKAVREYEETIENLRRENLDLKMRLFLCEEAHKETYHVKGSYKNEKEDCIQIIVKLRIEAEDLKKELDGKDEELQSVVYKYAAEIEKYKLEILDLEEKNKELAGVLEELPKAEDYNEVKEHVSAIDHENDFLKQQFAEKSEEMENANLQIKELEDKIVSLNKKVKSRDEAIKRCALRYHEETDHIPKHLRPVIKSVIEAAVKNDESKLISSMEEFERSLSKIMGAPIPSKLQSTYLRDSHSKNSSTASSSRSSNSSLVKDSSASDDSFRDAVCDHSGIVEGNLDGTEVAPSNFPISQSDRTIQCNLGTQMTESSDLEVEENFNIMRELKSQLDEAYSKINYLENKLEKRQNLLDLDFEMPFVHSADKASQYDLERDSESLMEEIKSGTIQNLSVYCSKLEKQEQELKDQLSKALSKIESLELELENRKCQVNNDSEKDNSSCQTDITWHSLHSRVSDKNLQELGTSNSISELKEEILMLVLAIEQKDKDLSDFHQKLLQDSLLTPHDEGYAAERDELQHRLAVSCSINNELLRHLQSLERFMEDLLQKNNLSASSFENINESADFFARLSDCLDRSLKCSRTLSDQLSICENSRFFEGNDTTMQRSEFNASERKSIGPSLDSQFSQEESDIPYIYQEETSKWSFTCKKCNKQSQHLDDTLVEGNSNDNLQELQQLYDENSNQKSKIEDLSGRLQSKEKFIESLNEEKNNLANEINVLKEKLTGLQKSNIEKDSLNEGLKSIVESLELNKKESDAAFDKLQTELSQTKERLVELNKRCAKYENSLSSYSQEKTGYEEKLAKLEQREKELLKNIKDMTLQKDSLLDKLKKEEKCTDDAKKENSEMAEKVNTSSQEILQLKNSIKKLKELNDSLQNAKSLVEKNLDSSNSEKETLKAEVKSLKEEIENLKSNCDSLEAEIQFLTNSKQNIIDLLSNFESSFALNLKTLSEVCDMKFDLDVENFEDVEEMSYLVDESEQVPAFLKNIIMENLKFKNMLPDFCQKIETIQEEKQSVEGEKHQLEKIVMLKEGEIKDLSDEIKKLQDINDEINALHNSALAFKTDHELLEKQKSLLEQKESNIKTLEKRNHDLKEILLKERSNSDHALNTANLKIFSLEDQLKEIDKVKSDHELLEKQKSLLEEKESHIKTYEKKNSELEERNKILLNEKKSYEQALESAKAEISLSREHLITAEKSSEDYKNMLNSKQDDVDKLQKRIVSLQSHINELLDEKINLSQRRQSKLKETPERAMSPDSSTIIEDSPDSHLQSVSKVDSDNSYSSAKSIENDQILPSNTAQKDLKSFKSLQRELKAANKRIEMLEKEKNSLRENLLSYVHNSKRTSTEKVDEDDFKADKLADLNSKLETKQSFIEELKSHLYKANDSLIDKQKEVDNLKRELLKFKRLNEDNARTLLQHIPNSRLSDAFLQSTETSNKDLRKQKEELMNSLLGLQKQFYEAKNMHLGHFEKFTRHIDNLRALQVGPSLLKSESAPVLNSPLMPNVEQSRKWERALKNAQIDLVVDIECYQNLKIFLNGFLAPVMSQSSNSESKDDKAVQTDLQKETSKSVRSRDTSKFPSKSFSSSGEQLQIEREEPSHDRLAATASAISLKLDWIESMLKTVIEEFEQLSGMESIINETTREASAKSILLKLFDRLESLQENANEIFYMNSRLKSLKIFDNDQFHHSSNISDHESLLSDETIALSRSVSISPVSFDGQFAPGYQKLKGRSLIHSYIKQSEEMKRSPLRPSHKVISSSQDSIFQRTHDSSPDLGIESDPNHEHSAPEQAEKFHLTKIGASKHDLSGSAMYRNLDKQRLSSIHNFSGSSFMFKDKSPFVMSNTLHAIGSLQDYELLKKEISESIVGIKSILSRTGDGMQQITYNTSPRKLQNLEFSTFKAIKDTCMNIDVCLQKADKLVNNFWVAACPTEEELRQLRQLNEELNSQMIQLYESKKKQEIEFNDALDRLKQAEIYNEKQEQKISKKLVKTKHILRVAEKKILETRNKERPLSAKGCSKTSVNPQ